MEKENKKFKYLGKVSMTGNIEEVYLKFIGDNYSKDSMELIKLFKDITQSEYFTRHAKMIRRNDTLVLIQSSKFLLHSKEYTDHQLWLFQKTGHGKYDWILERYRL